MPQLNSGGGDDLGANDEMISFKDEGEQDEKIQENAFTERDLADLKSSLVNESEINQNSNTVVVRRGQHDEQRVYPEKHREHLEDVSKQDGGMYKAPAYSGYPFLMLTDPYLPSGSVSPSVSYTLTRFSFTMNIARALATMKGPFWEQEGPAIFFALWVEDLVRSV
ncbi:hypothetical protein ACEWY4_009863 [Coilia grayii]|uniref:CTNNB1 binding N-teminal domain-containing protein n=1 Tax=Coilia grayii TaxID=363190 RepID=A0ABD1K7M2_9TELE